MKRTIVCCDVCGAVMTDMERMEDHYGIDLEPMLDSAKVAQRFSLYIHNHIKTPYGSSSKGSSFGANHVCSAKCLARALNRMLSDANIKLEVKPVLESA